MKKRISFLCIVLALALLVAACGSTQTTTAATTAATSAATTTKAPAATTAATTAAPSGTTTTASGFDASWNTSDVIKLGVAITVTGPQSAVGVESQRGMEIAVKEINDAGGINGKKLAVTLYDDQGTPEAALRAVTRLVEQDKVHVLFGPMASNSMMAVGQYLNDKKQVTIGPAVGVAWLRQGWDYIFRCTSNTYVQTIQAIEMLKAQKVKKLAVFNINEEYGNNSKKDMLQLIKDNKLEITIVGEEVYKNGDTDFTSQSVKIAKAAPDAVYMVAWANDVGSLLKQLRAAGYTGPVIGDNSFPGKPIRDVAGPAANNTFFTAAYILPDTVAEIDANPSFKMPMMNKFLHTYYNTYKMLPTNDNCYRSYDAIYIYKEAITKAKALDATKIRDALTNIKGLERLVGTMDYVGNKGEGIFNSKMFKIENGTVLEYKP